MMSASFGTKIASTRPSGLEKIVGHHQILDGQTAFQLYILSYILSCTHIFVVAAV